MEIQSRKLQVLLVLGILLSFSLTFATNENLLVAGLNMLGEDHPLYGVYLMDPATGECEYYTPEHYLPPGSRSITGEDGKACADAYRAFVLEQRIAMIENGTDSRAIEDLLSEAEKELAEKNVEAAEDVLDRIRVERNYTVRDTG
ncbi:MAG: hypothetical protein ABEJ03_02160 [Candidatus Nanohaloarchaea archaeon]